MKPRILIVEKNEKPVGALRVDDDEIALLLRDDHRQPSVQPGEELD